MPLDPRNIGWQQGRRHSSQTKSLDEEVKTPSILWTRKGRRMKRRNKGEREEEETERRKKRGGDLSSDSRTVLSPRHPTPAFSLCTHSDSQSWVSLALPQYPSGTCSGHRGEGAFTPTFFSHLCQVLFCCRGVSGNDIYYSLISNSMFFNQSTPEKIGMLISHRETLCLPYLTAVSSVEKLVSGERGREGALALAIS